MMYQYIRINILKFCHHLCQRKIPWLTNLYPIPVLTFAMQTDVWLKKNKKKTLMLR